MGDRPRRQGQQPLRVAGAALGLLAALATGPAQGSSFGLGTRVREADLQALTITIYPDGTGLPAGRGDVAQGRALYAQRCAACHGATGIEGPAARLAGSDGFIAWNDLTRPLRIARHPVLMLSVGAMWPYPTTIFDYVRRAMPHTAPKSLANDEVYALTAYLLHLQGVLPDGATVDASTLPRIRLPGRARTVMPGPGLGSQQR